MEQKGESKENGALTLLLCQAGPASRGNAGFEGQGENLLPSETLGFPLLSQLQGE